MKNSKKVRQKVSKNEKISIIPYNGFFKFSMIFSENRKSKVENLPYKPAVWPVLTVMVFSPVFV